MTAKPFASSSRSGPARLTTGIVLPCFWFCFFPSPPVKDASRKVSPDAAPPFKDRELSGFCRCAVSAPPVPFSLKRKPFLALTTPFPPEEGLVRSFFFVCLVTYHPMVSYMTQASLFSQVGFGIPPPFLNPSTSPRRKGSSPKLGFPDSSLPFIPG